MLAAVSFPALGDNSLDHSQGSISSPAWLGLTPLYRPESDEETQVSERLKNAEQVMSHGRRGFWYGLGGLAASVIFDKMQLVPGRTISYSVMGLGWLTWLGAYGKATSILSGTHGDHDSKSSHPKTFAKASTQGEIGEASNMFLIPDGAYIHPIYNDVNGGTDKFLTGSAKMGLSLGTDNFGWESVAYWRLLTPSFRREFGLPDLPTPVGRYADWQEIKTSFSGLSNVAGWHVRHQVSIGYNDVGPKGGKEFHQQIHRVTRNSIDHLEYIDQPEGNFWSFNEELGVVSRICLDVAPCFDHAITIEATQGKFMREAGVRYNVVQVQSPRWWENAFELRLIRQLKSEVYEGIRPWRYEVAIGARVLKVITPTVKYVSQYLDGDDVGQSYFDLLHYNYEF